MDTGNARLRLLVELGSAAAVVTSLVFVGLEVRQGTVATQAATLQALNASSAEVSRIMLENPDIRVAVAKWVQGEVIEGDEAYSARVLILTFMRHLENTFDQVQLGTVQPSVLDRWFSNATFSSPNFPEWWDGNRDRFGPEFGELVDERTNHTGAPAG